MRVADGRTCHLSADLFDDSLEQLAVLAALDGIDVRADQLDAVLLEDTALVQRDCGIERGLTTQSWQQRVRPLLAR